MDDEPMTIPGTDPRAVDLLYAIRSGDLDGTRGLLAAHPGLARARVLGGDGKGWRTPLHMVTDWPGYFPNGPQMVRLLAAAGASLEDRPDSPGSETPLHWAASSDDLEVAEALVDAGADIEAPGGSIGTPIANATGYACWHVARMLRARGAHVDALWIAAALGDWPAFEALLDADPAPNADEISQAFWHACHGGQVRVARRLLALGADPSFIPDYSRETVEAVASHPSTRRQALTVWLRETGTTNPRPRGYQARKGGDSPEGPGAPKPDAQAS
jgi:hypothetical protein